MTLPLEGVKIVDLSRLLPGPYCSMLLSDLGADVVAIHMPTESSILMQLQRNKRSMTLNLKDERAREIFFKLVADADIVLEGFRPGVTTKLGVDYESVKKTKPDIIYCSITGFGQTGPYKDIPGHDINYIGYGGVLGGLDHTPTIPSIPISDMGSSMFAVVSLLAALLHRQKTGAGQYIDVSMSDAILSFTSTEIGHVLANGGLNAYGIYDVKDGQITLGALEAKFAMALDGVLEDAADDAQKGSVSDPEVMAAILKTKTVAEWLDLFNAASIPCSPVYSPEEAYADAHNVSRGTISTFDGPFGEAKQVAFPAKFSGADVQTIRSPPSSMGQHTDEILKALGYDDATIQTYHDDGVV